MKDFAGKTAVVTGGGPVWTVPNKDWDWVMGVNFYGVLYGVQAVIPHMLEHGEGSHIVNTASLAGLMPGFGTYGVSKHAVLALSESLAADLAGTSVGVSVLCPGYVRTNIAAAERNRPNDLDVEQTQRESDLDTAMFTGMLEQGMAPSDVASVVFDAIERDAFYVLPHPAWDDVVRSRANAVLARGKVASVDFESLMARAAQGEQL